MPRITTTRGRVVILPVGVLSQNDIIDMIQDQTGATEDNATKVFYQYVLGELEDLRLTEPGMRIGFRPLHERVFAVKPAGEIAIFLPKTTWNINEFRAWLRRGANGQIQGYVTREAAMLEFERLYDAGLVQRTGLARYRFLFYRILIQVSIPRHFPVKVEYTEYYEEYVPPPEPEKKTFAGILKWSAPGGQVHPSKKYKFVREFIVFDEYNADASEYDKIDHFMGLMKKVLDDMKYPDIETIMSWRIAPGSTQHFEVAEVSEVKKNRSYEYREWRKEESRGKAKLITEGRV